MLTRSQIYTLLLLRQRDNTLFSKLPIELIRDISDFGQDPNSDFAKALHHVAYGELTEAKALLDQHPRLVLQAGTVVTPGDLTVVRTTLLECALGAGDPEMAAMILPYFSHVTGGENEKEQQLARYRPCIEGMLNQTPYDLTGLLEIIKTSSAKAITAALNKDMNYASQLRDALIQFRKDVTPGTVTRPRMHYSYSTLINAFEILDREWDNLMKNRDGWDLIWRQGIGYLQRGLPAVDRFASARGLFYIVANKAPIERLIEFKHGGGSFQPATGLDFVGLGFDYAVAPWGGVCPTGGLAWSAQHLRSLLIIQAYIEQKSIRLAELIMPAPPKSETAATTLSC